MVPLSDIQEQFHDAYYELTEEEKQELLEEFRDVKKDRESMCRPTVRGRTQDVQHVAKLIAKLVRHSLLLKSILT
jgi:hypothetical protein